MRRCKPKRQPPGWRQLWLCFALKDVSMTGSGPKSTSTQPCLAELHGLEGGKVPRLLSDQRERCTLSTGCRSHWHKP